MQLARKASLGHFLSPADQVSAPCSRTMAAVARALPIVYHPSYSTPRLPPGHRFPMKARAAIINLILVDEYALILVCSDVLAVNAALLNQA